MPTKANHTPLTKYDYWKYEIAQELGLLDKVLAHGWGGLTASESGRIGGLINRRRLGVERQQDKDE